MLRGGPLEHTRHAGLPGRKDGEREKAQEKAETSPLPAARARHINSNGKRIKPPHFLTRRPEPLIFAEREKFSAYFREEGDPLRYIALNATALARNTYVRNSSLGRTHRNFPDHVSSKASA